MKTKTTRLVDDKLVFFLQQQPTRDVIPHIERRYIALLEHQDSRTKKIYYSLRVWGQNQVENELEYWPSSYAYRWMAVKYAFYYADLVTPVNIEKTYVSFLQERRFFVSDNLSSLYKKISKYPVTTDILFVDSEGNISPEPSPHRPSVVWTFTEDEITFYTMHNMVELTLSEKMYRICQAFLIYSETDHTPLQRCS